MPPLPEKPLDALRVRVAGVTGFTAADRERVRLVAEDIALRTGLDVDVTLGSSPAPQRLDLQAGKYGRPELLVDQLWVQKGVGVRLLTAVDRKSLLLNAVVLAVCTAVVANAALASVRARRREMGTLSALGWGAGRIFGLVLGELLLLALAAGVLGALGALALAAVTGADLGAGRAGVAIPVALLVAGVAGVGPAWHAARLTPVAALRPAGSGRSGGRGVRRHLRGGVLGLGWRAVTAVPGRSLLAISGLALATAGLGVLASVQAEFRGRAVGTLLGDAVSIQVRPGDQAAVAALLTLAGAGVLQAMATELQERRTEFALLRAFGWGPGRAAAVLLGQAAVLGFVGAAVGAGVALAVDRILFGDVTASMVGALVAAGGVAVLVALVATVLPAARVQRVDAPQLLADE